MSQCRSKVQDLVAGASCKTHDVPAWDGGHVGADPRVLQFGVPPRADGGPGERKPILRKHIRQTRDRAPLLHQHQLVKIGDVH